MKKFLVAFVTMSLVVFPGTALAVTPSLQVDNPNPGVVQLPVLSLSCEVQGTVKALNSVSNEITYQVHYSANYGQNSDVNYEIRGVADLTTNLKTVYLASGSTSFKSGQGFFEIKGSTTQKFTFTSKGVPGVTLKATVKGVGCKEKFFKTVQYVVPPIAAPTLKPNLTINPNIIVTSSLGAPAPAPAGNNPGNVVPPPVGSNPSNGNVPPGQGSVVASGAAQNSAPVVNADGTIVAAGGFEADAPLGEETVFGEDMDMYDGNRPTGALSPEEEVKRQEEAQGWSGKDYAVAGLLGALFVSIVTFGVMKYKGMM